MPAVHEPVEALELVAAQRVGGPEDGRLWQLAPCRRVSHCEAVYGAFVGGKQPALHKVVDAVWGQLQKKDCRLPRAEVVALCSPLDEVVQLAIELAIVDNSVDNEICWVEGLAIRGRVPHRASIAVVCARRSV